MSNRERARLLRMEIVRLLDSALSGRTDRLDNADQILAAAEELVEAEEAADAELMADAIP